MTPPLKSFLVVINKKWARILNRIHRRTQKALNLLKIWPTDLDTFLDCQTVFIRLSVCWWETTIQPYFEIKSIYCCNKVSLVLSCV